MDRWMHGGWINEFYSISDPVCDKENTNLLLPFFQRKPPLSCNFLLLKEKNLLPVSLTCPNTCTPSASSLHHFCLWGGCSVNSKGWCDPETSSPECPRGLLKRRKWLMTWHTFFPGCGMRTFRDQGRKPSRRVRDFYLNIRFSLPFSLSTRFPLKPHLLINRLFLPIWVMQLWAARPPDSLALKSRVYNTTELLKIGTMYLGPQIGPGPIWLFKNDCPTCNIKIQQGLYLTSFTWPST